LVLCIDEGIIGITGSRKRKVHDVGGSVEDDEHVQYVDNDDTGTGTDDERTSDYVQLGSAFASGTSAVYCRHVLLVIFAIVGLLDIF
jgi:hypothetical protein